MGRESYKYRHWRDALGAAFALGLLPSLACAQEPFASKPATPGVDQMRCRALGEGYFAVAGSNACIKISGYIAAGVDFAAPVRAGPLARSAVVGPPVGIDSSAAVSLDAQFDTPLGPGRLYVQVGRDHIAP